MSIIVSAFVPEGIAMAADSRLTGYRNYENGTTDRYSLSDNSQKLFLLNKTRIGICECGDALINGKTIADFLRVFEITQVKEKDTVEVVAKKLSVYIKNFSDNPIFQLAGFIKDEPYIFHVDSQQCMLLRSKNEYGALWNGEIDAISRLLLSEEKTRINFDLMPLKDCADLVEFLVELTIKYQRFEDRVATCGGPIDVLIITKDKAHFIKHKIYRP